MLSAALLLLLLQRPMSRGRRGWPSLRLQSKNVFVRVENATHKAQEPPQRPGEAAAPQLENMPDFLAVELDSQYLLEEDGETEVLEILDAEEDYGRQVRAAEDNERHERPKRRTTGSDEAVLFDSELLITREQGWLGDSKISDIASDYGFPLDFVMETLTKWGVPPPIQAEARLGDLVTAEQAFALLEALTSLDRADVHDDYIEETLDELAEIFGASIADIFQVCGEKRLNLGNGIDTRLSLPDFKILCMAMGWPIPEAYLGR